MMEFRHILFETTGGHDWQPIDSDWKFTDHKGQEYIVEKCTQCGMTAQRYIAVGGDKKGRGDGFIDSLYISPAYPREHVMKCPEEMGLFKHPEEGALIAVLYGGEGKAIKTKKKHKKKKKGKKKKDKKVKVIRTRGGSKKEVKRKKRKRTRS